MSSDKIHYELWPTAFGPMAAVAGPAGLRRVILPNYQSDQLLEVLAWEYPDAKREPAAFVKLIELSRDYFNARDADFSQIGCDANLPAMKAFSGQVLNACRTIPYGQTLSYSALAYKIGRPDAARALASALGKNPIPLVIPCHRVIYSDGRAGGFSAEGGVPLKEKMLALEASRS